MSLTSSPALSMARGFDGRIEAAFAKCKEAGEAAFVTFLTAGFPVKEGKKHMHRIIIIIIIIDMLEKFSTRIYNHVFCKSGLLG